MENIETWVNVLHINRTNKKWKKIFKMVAVMVAHHFLFQK